jgi:hypothetical protein
MTPEPLKEPDHQAVEAVVVILMHSALPRRRITATMPMPCVLIVLVAVVE